MRLIDKEKLCKQLEKFSGEHIPAHSNFEVGVAETWAAAADFVSDFEAVDAEPVVRCKDCIFLDENDRSARGDEFVCWLHSSENIKEFVSLEDFCSKGTLPQCLEPDWPVENDESV